MWCEACCGTCENGPVSAKVPFLKFGSSRTLKRCSSSVMLATKTRSRWGNGTCKPTGADSSRNRHEPAQTTNGYSSVLRQEEHPASFVVVAWRPSSPLKRVCRTLKSTASRYSHFWLLGDCFSENVANYRHDFLDNKWDFSRWISQREGLAHSFTVQNKNSLSLTEAAMYVSTPQPMPAGL